MADLVLVYELDEAAERASSTPWARSQSRGVGAAEAAEKEKEEDEEDEEAAAGAAAGKPRTSILKIASPSKVGFGSSLFGGGEAKKREAEARSERREAALAKMEAVGLRVRRFRTVTVEHGRAW